MIRILIVDDSETEIQILKSIVATDRDIEVVGCANNGKEALAMVKKLKPDLITMDIVMPLMDGIEAIHMIMMSHPTPIVVISSKLNDNDLNFTFRALDAGALSVLEKPEVFNSPTFEATKKRVLETIKNMASIHVIKRKARITPSIQKIKIKPSLAELREYEILAIGTSVGGPQALKSIFTNLLVNFPVPIVVVQHMTPGFMTGFTKWLNDNTPLSVKVASDEEKLQPGTIYFAPDKYHLKVARQNQALIARLTQAPPVSGFCPSATVLMQSVAHACGKKAIGVLLTGMGNDGAQGLLEIKEAHGLTIIQDEESTVVFGMAGVAQAIGAVDKVVDLDKMASYLNEITSKSKTPVE